MSTHSEQIVLGKLLTNNEFIHDVIPLLTAECFKGNDNRRVYRHILQFQYEEKPFDMFSIADALGDEWVSICGQLVSESCETEPVRSVVQLGSQLRARAWRGA